MSVVLVAGIIAQRFGGELVDRRSGERLYLLETIPWAPALVLLALTPGRRRRWRARWCSASAGP